MLLPSPTGRLLYSPERSEGGAGAELYGVDLPGSWEKVSKPAGLSCFNGLC